MISYDSKKIKRLLDNIHIAWGVSCAFFCSDCTPLYITDNHETLCNRINATATGTCKCECSDRKILLKCMQSGAPVSHICHAGLKDTAIPIYKSGILVGCLIIGRLRPSEQPIDLAKNLAWLGDDVEVLQKWYLQLPYFTPEQLQAMIELLTNVMFDGCIHIEGEDVAQSALYYIDNHLQDELNVQMLCKELFVSKNRLYEAIRSRFDITINELIQQRRIKRAKELLSTTNQRIQDIATAVGMDNYVYFCKLFKQKVQLTPTKYRNNRT